MAHENNNNNNKAAIPKCSEINPICSLISNFQGLFNHHTKNKKKEEDTNPKLVNLPCGQPEMANSSASLKLQGGEVYQQQNGSVILWQVYAVGGFFVLRWVLDRLYERLNKKKPSSDEEPSPADD